MATSIYGTTDHAYIQVAVDWSVNWQDSDSNRTSLHVELWAHRTNTGYTTSGTFSGGLTIDGVNYAGVSKQVAITNAWLKLTEHDIGIVHNADGNRSVALSAYGSIPGTGWNNTYVSGTAVLDRLWAAPPLPTGVLPVWVSDSRFDVGITHGSPGARNPILSTQLQRRRVPETAWVQIMDVGGAVASFTDSGVATNSAYVYRSAVWNYATQVGWRESATAYTTPAAPTTVSAGKNLDLSITVNWVSGSSYVPESFRIFDNGTLAATVAGTVSTWTHVSPNASVAHTYSVAAVQGTLESARTAAPPVQLLTPPLAPTNLAPSGTNVAVGSVTFSWTHNPVDSTPQTQASIRYRIAGATSWTSLAATTAQTVSATLAIGSYEWQVQTRGAHASFGPWSNVATFAVVALPTLTVSTPTTPLTTSVVTTNWVWGQAQGLAQTGWTARLETAGGQLVESRSGTGATASTTFAARVSDLTGYVVRVTATNGALSVTASRSFNTVFAPPKLPSLTAVWDEAGGRAQITFASGGGSPATVSLDLERSIDGGLTWEPVLIGAIGGSALADGECLSSGSTLYRVTAFSATPSTASTTVELVTDSPAVWVSGGAGYALSARLPYDPAVGVTAGRSKTLVAYQGRSLPVAYTGGMRSRVVQLAGSFLWHSQLDDAEAVTASLDALIALAQDPAPTHLYRTPDGLRIYGQLSEVATTRESGRGLWSYSATLTETVN